MAASTQHRTTTPMPARKQVPFRTTVASVGRIPPASASRQIAVPIKVTAPEERRGRRRVAVMPMYSPITVRLISRRQEPLEGHVLDVSETGLAIEMDCLIPIGQPVAIEFRIAGLGRLRADQWTEFTAVAEIVRHENVDEFPGGPYKMGLRYVQMPTMAQAQIARFLATHPV